MSVLSFIFFCCFICLPISFSNFVFCLVNVCLWFQCTKNLHSLKIHALWKKERRKRIALNLSSFLKNRLYCFNDILCVYFYGAISSHTRCLCVKLWIVFSRLIEWSVQSEFVVSGLNMLKSLLIKSILIHCVAGTGQRRRHKWHRTTGVCDAKSHSLWWQRMEQKYKK